MRVPPGVRRADFADAIKEFEAAKWQQYRVFTSDEDVDTYRDSYSLGHENEEPLPSAAIAPGEVEQVQAVCQDREHAQDSAMDRFRPEKESWLRWFQAPPLGGSVGAWILEAHESRASRSTTRIHYALVEPGVSYLTSTAIFRNRDWKVWTDPPDPGWGSLVGNALERGGGYTPMRDHFDCHCGMEVVLANGDVVRTGWRAAEREDMAANTKYGFFRSVVRSTVFSVNPISACRHQEMGFGSIHSRIVSFCADVMVVDSTTTCTRWSKCSQI